MIYITKIEETLALTNLNVSYLSLINVNLYSKKDKSELHESKLQCIVDNKAYSHHKLNKIINV